MKNRTGTGNRRLYELGREAYELTLLLSFCMSYL